MSMRRLFIALLILFAPALVLAKVSSIDHGYSENVKNYEVEANLEDNARIDVTETIVYDFGTNEKHGIYRYIPTVYTGRNGSPRQSISVKFVQDNDGKAQPYSKTNENNNEVLQIGDPNTLISGLHTYKISYTLTHMVSSDTDGDRFRWDAIGTGWNVPIKNVLARITNSSKLLSSRETANCYFGTQGSTNSCDFLDTGGDALVVSKTNLPLHAGLTIDSLYSSGTFPGPGKLELLFWGTPWYYSLPFIALIIFLSLWYEKGRDPKGRGTIVPMYDPPTGLTPFESSIILDDTISRKSLPAAIISLAIQGYIKIHRKEVKILFVNKTEYELELLKPIPQTAPKVEQKVSDLFFIGRTTVNLNNLGSSFALLNQSLHKTAYEEVTQKGYFVVNPTISRIIFFAVSAALIVFGVLAAIYMLLAPINYIFFILPGVISLLFTFIMPVKTKAGAIAKEDLLGLKMYIGVAEIDRIKFHNAPAKSPEKFEELLPYAIIFGLEKQWAEEFKDIYNTPPNWYDGNFATFSVIALTNDLGSFSNAAMSAATSSSSGGAGGFAGGGGGGGGGGSW